MCGSKRIETAPYHPWYEGSGNARILLPTHDVLYRIEGYLYCVQIKSQSRYHPAAIDVVSLSADSLDVYSSKVQTPCLPSALDVLYRRTDFLEVYILKGQSPVYRRADFLEVYSPKG